MGSDERRVPPSFDELSVPLDSEELEATELGRGQEHEPTETLRGGRAPWPPPEEGLALVDDTSTELQRPSSEPAPPAAPWVSDEEIPWRALHPASLLVNLVPQTWRMVLGFWPLLLAALFGGRSAGMGLGDGLFFLLLLGSGAASTLVHFLTLRYRVANGRLEIRQGLLSRQARVIDPARIQNMSMVRNPFHRMSGLVELRLETAGEGRSEGMLSALSEAEAQELIQALSSAKRAAAPEPSASPPMLRSSPLELLALGLSRPRVGVILVAWALGTEFMGVVGPAQSEDVMRQLTPLRMVALGLLIFGASWLGSAVMALVRHFGFELRQIVGADGLPRLHGQQGLFTRTAVEVPLRKVQLVGADEPWLRRAMGYGAVSVQTAGSGDPTQGSGAELQVPMVEQERLGELFRAAIPQAGVDPWADPLEPPHPRVLRRQLVSASVRSLILAAGAMALWWPWGALLILWWPIAMLAAWLDFRAQGWVLTDTVLVGREGFWRRVTWMIPRDKVQSVRVTQGPLLRWHGLSRVVVNTAGSRVVLPLLGSAQAEAVQEALTAGG